MNVRVSSYAIAAALLSSSALVPAAAKSPADPCTSLADFTTADATITLAQSISAGNFTAPDGSLQQNLPAFCEVHGIAKPVPNSTIGFELWLPAAGWNGKIEMLGNGGYSSAISYGSMASLLQQGYATLGTDTGHTGDDPLPFIQGATNPEIIVDWGHRAVHESVVNAKLVLEKYYRKHELHAYFNGCSTGGHQAFMEVQRYPDDFDGVIAGDPGHNRTHLNAGFLRRFIDTHPPGDNNTADRIIPVSKLAMVTAAAVAQCKTQDGGLAANNFLNDPRDCHFDPAVLQCTGADSPSCLTAPQVTAFKKLYAGTLDARDGDVIYPAWPPGSETGWNSYWGTTEPTRANFWRYWVYNDANWDWWTFDWDKDMKFTDDKLAPVINAMDPDITRFKRHGGKLIQYHGFADPVVAPADSIDYYERVLAYLGGDEAEHDRDRDDRHGAGKRRDKDHRASRDSRVLGETQEFYRLFMVPGMGHCSGGPGATVFDVQTALEQWVEEGVTPDRIIASHSTKGVVDFTRPLCPYPKIAVYKGVGDTSSADSFNCVGDDDDQNQMPAREFLR